jgi:putative transposase
LKSSTRRFTTSPERCAADESEAPKEVQKRRNEFLRKGRLRHPAVASSLEEAGDRLFTFITLPPSQWKSARTTNAIERPVRRYRNTPPAPTR